MKNYFEYLPQVSYAAGILNSVFTGNNRIAATDHLTISDIDPDKFDLIFVLCAETTFKIRPIINQFREKVVLIHTSVEPGLEEYNNYFFPHWLFAVKETNNTNDYITRKASPKYSYNMLLGRAKDWRTDLLRLFDERNLLDKGMVSYHYGKHYMPETTIDPTPYFRSVWEYEDELIKQLYNNDLNYNVKNDSTTRLVNGHFSSCLIPRLILNESIISVITETDLGAHHAFFTEKTWKSFLGNQHCIFYTGKKHEDYLIELGFELMFPIHADPLKVVNIIGDIERAGIKGYTFRDWDELTSHNYYHANSKHWENNFYKWLLTTF